MKKNRIYPAQVPDDILDEIWLKKYWKQSAAWLYLLICLFDFMLAPILVGVMSWHAKGVIPYAQWQPITLQGGGLFHVAFGTILGISAWTHTSENVAKLQFGMLPTDSATQTSNTSDNVAK